MLRKLLFLFLLLLSATTFGQIGGKSVYQFLNLAQSPRQAALGGKTVTIVDYDVNQAFYNPATINAEMHNRLSANYGSYFGEVSYGTAAYAYTYDRHLQTFHAGISYVNYGTFEGRDELGNLTSDFTGSEAALSVGYAYNIPWTDMFVGANAKLISSTLESYNSWGAAVDLGFLYVDYDNDINYGLTVRNLGFQIKPYQDTNEKLPLAIDAGISQLMENVPIRWHMTFENLQQWNIAFSNPNRAEGSLDGGSEEEKVSFFNNALRHVILGAELFPEKGFNIRLGYNFRRSEELRILEQRHFSGISVGFGLRFGKVKFDYSYSRYTVAANTSLFGLMIDLE
ncbi:type IX secretion system protein PorQ [Flavobacterium sp.]|uniref:type IX secretion system protein PorQ n=1 Tax=Flavobacterium sp. TaxID=239 RepID=UPI0008C15679|nr:type IX secretion system protein PorQ [Flavobacterium sp.]OGS62969.1 MAG: penicillin-binding protein [Flavobacteria bacterium GWF1_32_7]HBD25930.1 penicillin-binding protein [Flavobacterium sp.]